MSTSSPSLMPNSPSPESSTPPNSRQQGSRLQGLDLLRAVAIALVFMYHYMVFVSHEPTFGWLSQIGWVGVDLFFVLSGYLIGNQLFKGLAQQQTLSFRRFYWRRAMRTWPVFWLVLALYFLLPQLMGGNPPPPLWRFLTFTQNYQLMPGTAFSHAWSLCIEEQFYLLLPIVVWLCLKVARKIPGTKVQHAFWLMLALIAAACVYRYQMWLLYGPESAGQTRYFNAFIYYSSFARMDELLPGLALALFKNAYPTRWQGLAQHTQKLQLLAFAAVAIILYLLLNYGYIKGQGYGYFATVFGYSLLALAFALLLASALQPGSLLAKYRIPGAATLALWSYSLYLVHKPIGFIITTQAKTTGWHSTTVLILNIVLSLTVSAVLYKLIEAPAMKLRDRLAPNIFKIEGLNQNAGFVGNQ